MTPFSSIWRATRFCASDRYSALSSVAAENSAHGWRNVLCDDAYVAHVGGQSFAPLGLAPGGENLRRLVARYPRYNAEVADFIARDPLAPRRAALAALLAAAPAETPA